jgi:GT2 family glycosyltransferase
VIATYNRGQVLFDTIEMVMANKYPDFELIVVDQTPDPDPDYTERLDELQSTYDFTYFTLPEPSLTFARNVGIARASGDVVIFIDDDVELKPDFIAQHVACFAPPDVGAVAGRVVEAKGDKTDPSGRIGYVRPDGSFISNLHLERRADDIDFGRGCNMAFRREALMAVNGCDERYTGGFYREDGDLFARVKRQGYRVVFEPETSVVHLESGGGSRSDKGRKNLKRQYSVFRNETLYFLSCAEGSFPRFAYRMLRWTYARYRSVGYTFPEFLYLLGAFFGGIKAYFLEDFHRLSKKHGFESRYQEIGAFS